MKVLNNEKPLIRFRKVVKSEVGNLEQLTLFPMPPSKITYPQYLRECAKEPLGAMLKRIGLSDDEAKRLLLNYIEIEDKWIKEVLKEYIEVTRGK